MGRRAQRHGDRDRSLPGEALLELAEQNAALELVTQTSHDALPSLPRADAIVLDGDHNHYTLSRELELAANSAGDRHLPLLILHDIGWPHARRDTYYAPERIPPEHRQPLAENASLAPDEPGIAPGGIPFKWAAAREGGTNNGVLTAIEEFVGGREQLDFAQIPLFWGLGVIWDRGAPGAGAVAEVVAPWRDNPMLERVEQHRVAHLVALCRTLRELSDLEGVSAHQQALLRRMLDSSAFATGERLSRLKQRGHPMFSRDQIREALGELGEAEAEGSPASGPSRAASGRRFLSRPPAKLPEQTSDGRSGAVIRQLPLARISSTSSSSSQYLTLASASRAPDWCSSARS